MGMPFRYNYRNLFRRKLRTGLTVLGVGLVVATAVIMLAYSRGLIYSLRNNGDPENVMILARRATDCAFSSLKKGEYDILSGLVVDHLAFFPPVDAAAGGSAGQGNDEELSVDLIAPYVNHTFLIKIPGVEGGRYGERKLGLVKGVDPARAFHMNRQLELLAGRWMTEEDEKVAMVGSLAWARLGIGKEDLAVDKTLEFNGVSWPIVGIFKAAGTSADGEIWVPVDELLTVLNRPDYSYVIAKAEDVAGMETIRDLVNRTEQTALRAVSEVDYYRGFAETFRTFALIGGVMALVITIGGVMVGMNTMYTAVSGRVREIGMLQVLGFSKGAIVSSFVLESLLIALVGGLIGCALGSLVNGIPMKITMGVFLFRVDAVVLGIAMGLAVLIGVIGALVPALRAVRLRMVDAMRYI
jgi:ABC-type antimicrobial peptide transport system permease subunit